MLSKKNRLTSEKDFSKMFAKGKSVSARGIGMKFAKNTIGVPRIGFVVSTKISKRAVVRNLIKRRMREALRPHLANLLQQGIDAAFIARSESVQMAYQQIQETVQVLLEKAALIQRSQTRK